MKPDPGPARPSEPGRAWSVYSAHALVTAKVTSLTFVYMCLETRSLLLKSFIMKTSNNLIPCTLEND